MLALVTVRCSAASREYALAAVFRGIDTRLAVWKCLTSWREYVPISGYKLKARRFSVNKSELVDRVADGADLNNAQAQRAVDAFIDAVQGAVAKGEKVTLPGFGAWSRTERKARMGRNPRTGDPVQIAASKGVKFTAGAGFKSAVK
jgi:DNA-binding protein HU-beta